MRTAEPRTRAAKTVAQARKTPRAMRAIVLAYHEEEVPALKDNGEPYADGRTVIQRKLDGEGNPIPAVVRTFRVAPFPKIQVFIDRNLVKHETELAEGELDWSSGAITVGEQEFDEEGNLEQILHLSHDKQLGHNYRAPGFSYRDGKIMFTTRAARTPNAYVPRFNIMAEGAKRAPILTRWQMQADSPDAFWLDGVAPTKEQVEQQTKEWEDKRNARRRGEAVTNTPQPAAVTDDEGEDFSGDLDT
jgi:hypothetical protein